jgi:hypothetical protein
MLIEISEGVSDSLDPGFETVKKLVTDVGRRQGALVVQEQAEVHRTATADRGPLILRIRGTAASIRRRRHSRDP